MPSPIDTSPTTRKIYHLRIGDQYTPEDLEQLLGMFHEAAKDLKAGVVVTRDDVELREIEIPLNFGDVYVSQVSFGSTEYEIDNEEDCEDCGNCHDHCTCDIDENDSEESDEQPDNSFH